MALKKPIQIVFFSDDTGIWSREDSTNANDRPPELSSGARRGIQESWWSPHVNPTSGYTLPGFSVLGPKIPRDNHFPAALELLTFQVEFNH